MISHDKLTKIDTSNFRHILPKANEIVEVDLQLKRTIYPFKMTHYKHKSSSRTDQIEEYNAPSDGAKFDPPLPSVKQHFTRNLLIYDKFNNNDDEDLFNTNIFSVEKLKNLRNHDYVMFMEQTKPFLKEDLLTFDSRFESGNLSMVSKVEGLYCLLLHNDANTFGYTNWFYFRVKCEVKGIYRFAIMNYGKAGWPYNQGIGICTFSDTDTGKGWRRAGKNVKCQANPKIFSRSSSFNNFNTLSFEYEFTEDNQEVFFAYNIPYTYTQLCAFLDELENKELPFFYRKLAGRSLVGNRLEMVTITNFETTKHNPGIPVVVLLARAHAGQTVSSWVAKYFMQFLISDEPKARLLRDNFVFKIFPMINPDGVIHGNYRCSLSGRDLNRRWIKPSKDLFPEVYYIKNQVLDLSKNRPVKMIIDLHGHSQKKKVFIYGCNDKFHPHKCRLFPYMLSKVSKHFEFNYCHFSIEKSKLSTARVNLYQTLRIHNVFTLESSQYGIFDGHLNIKILSEIGRSLGEGLLLYFRPKPRTNLHLQTDQILKEFQENGRILEQELANNEQLLRSGNDHDSGSEGEPSVDNIAFDKLAKMNDRKEMNLHTNQSTIKKRGFKSLSNHQDEGHARFLRYPKNSQVKGSAKNPRKMSTSERLRSHRQYKRASSSNSSRSHIPKPSTPQVVRRTNAVRMINFSLSIEDETTNFTRFLTKIPAFKNKQWRFGYQQTQPTLISKTFMLKNKSHAPDCHGMGLGLGN